MLSTRNIVLSSIQKQSKHIIKPRYYNHTSIPNTAIIEKNNRILSTQVSSSSTKASSAPTSTSILSSNKYSLLLAGICLTSGYIAGRYHEEQYNTYKATNNNRVLPNGLPRACCEKEHDAVQELTKQQKELPLMLKSIVGSSNVLAGNVKNYTKGARIGNGDALCIVTPRSLQDVISCVDIIVNSDCTVLPQGRNTGLTGGSVPQAHNNNNRPTVIMSTKYLDKIIHIDNGHRVLCYAGVGIGTLSNVISKQFPDRESHSILGSTFLNPTTAAGISFGSGGTQLRKGPAYTDRALYLKIVENTDTTNNTDNKHTVEIVNTLGINGIDNLSSLEVIQSNNNTTTTLKSNENAQKSSDTAYAKKLCNINSEISRYNADTSGCECNRSEGKVFILATVHDTFKKPKSSKTYWISFSDYKTACDFRKDIALQNPQDLPTSMEYMNKDSFDIIDRSGRIMAHIIKLVGTTNTTILTPLWNIKLFIESLPFSGSDILCDYLLHKFNLWFFPILPKNIQKLNKIYDHHVMLTIPDYDGNKKSFHTFNQRVQDFQKSNNDNNNALIVHECTTQSDIDSLNAFRFVAAIAFRTWCVGEGVQGVSVDYALPKNYAGNDDSTDTTTEEAYVPLKRMIYAHFGCNVIHADLAFGNDVNVHEAKMSFKKYIENKCKGKLPAEHGHGTEYHAPIETMQRWKKMDPCNVMNPGIGGLSNGYKYRD